MTAFVIGTLLPWLLVLVGGWLLLQLVRQNGRILLRLEAIEQRIPPRPGTSGGPPAQGLPVGSPAPEFELPDLQGRIHKLSEFRGRDLLLIFFNPGCGHCSRMTADLAALPPDGSRTSAVPIVVSTGDVAEHLKLVEQHGIRCLVLLQSRREVADRYRAHGTPMGYRVDAAGRIASELTIGAESLLSLSAHSASGGHAPGASRNGSSHKPAPDPSLARSQLNRNGLKAGAVAPEFTLPRIDGGELSLADFRGHQTLLVFSDPDCGPCDELAPRLQSLHSEHADLKVLMISRRDMDATRDKAATLGLTFPIAMQKQWELSLKYGMFATPIGYLVDEQGVLQSDVAVGVEPILQLAGVSAAAATGAAEPLLATGQLVPAQ
ncbi:MAG: TlpA family protein disulfide reductase [Planctomycetaceae bacterium]|nr:TlpA family protein disulfide reductase [Planctomycetaceae bacterium]